MSKDNNNSDKKHKYRGKGKVNRRDSLFSIYLYNIRGYKNKAYSLKKILKKVKPSIALINETQLVGNMKVSLDPAYSSWTRNRKEKGGGGIATAVSRQYSDTAVGAGEGYKDKEYLIVRIEAFSPALNIVNSYGEQRKTKKEDVKEKWETLKKKLEEMRMRGEFVVYGGDLNKLVGQDQFGVPGNNKEISLGGKLLRELLASGNWVLVNGLGREIVEGGPFTRVDPASGNMSCLDLFIVSKELLPYVDKLVIDKERKIIPTRAVKEKKKYKLIYTDHYSCLLSFKDLTKRKEKVKDKKKQYGTLLKKMDGMITKGFVMNLVTNWKK